MSRRRKARPKEAFLSHAHGDLSFVRKIARVLQAHGIGVWYSEQHILGGEQWHDEIGRALTRCDWLLLVLTPSAVRSKWVKRELLYALQEDRYDGRIVPLLRRACEHAKLSWALASFQVIDFTRDFDGGCRDLLRIWGM